MSTILSYLDSIKLSMTQIGLLIGSTIVGGLVLALKLQGTELHRVQLQLLEQTFHITQDKQDAAVDAARAAFNAAKKEFVDNGGEL